MSPDFDTLVDSPLLIGNPELHEFEVDKTPHVLANLGGDGIWESERSATDTQRLVEEEAAFWGQMPYDDYAFINILAETGGGLEHKNSSIGVLLAGLLKQENLPTDSANVFHALPEVEPVDVMGLLFGT